MAYPTSIKNIQRYLEKSLRITKPCIRLESDTLSEEEELLLLHNAELIADAMRERLGKRTLKNDGPLRKRKVVRSALMEISVDHGFLALSVPELLNRRYNDAWYLRKLAASLIGDYISRGIWCPLPEQRYYFCFVRYYNGEEKVRRPFDNDNVEAHQIVDGIADGMGMDDSALRVQLVFATKQSDKSDAKVYIIPAKNIIHFMEFWEDEE